MPPEVSYSFDPYQMMGDYENSPSSDNDFPNPNPNNPVYGAIGYVTSIPFQANAQVMKAFGPTRNFGRYLEDVGMSMRSERSQRAAKEYEKRRNLLAAMREHPMEVPHRVAQGMVIAGEAYLLGRGIAAGVATIPRIAAGAAALPFATSIAGQATVNFGNAYNDLREAGYPRGRAAFRASGDAAISAATDLAGGAMKFAARPLARVGIEAGDETINEIGGNLYGMIPQSRWYYGQPVEEISAEGLEPVPLLASDPNPNPVPTVAPRLEPGYRVPVRREPNPDPTYVPGGAYWRNAETGEAYYAERPVVRQNMQRDRWIDEQEALDYPFGY